MDRRNYSPLHTSDTVSHSSEESLEGIACFELDDNRRLIVTCSKSRAEKDRLDREKVLERLKGKLENSKNPVEQLWIQEVFMDRRQLPVGNKR